MHICVCAFLPNLYINQFSSAIGFSSSRAHLFSRLWPQVFSHFCWEAGISPKKTPQQCPKWKNAPDRRRNDEISSNETLQLWIYSDIHVGARSPLLWIFNVKGIFFLFRLPDSPILEVMIRWATVPLCVPPFWPRIAMASPPWEKIPCHCALETRECCAKQRLWMFSLAAQPQFLPEINGCRGSLMIILFTCIYVLVYIYIYYYILIFPVVFPWYQHFPALERLNSPEFHKNVMFLEDKQEEPLEKTSLNDFEWIDIKTSSKHTVFADFPCASAQREFDIHW